MKKFIISILITISIIIGNTCYWLFSNIQTKCVKKINSNIELSLYEKSSIMSLHLGICSLGYLYCSDAAYANFKMLITNKDSIYLYSKDWLTPKIKSRFNNNQLGKMTWDGNIDYAFNSLEKNGAVLLNWCILDERYVNNRLCYVAECDYTWKQPSKTTFKITENFSIIIYEQLFYELEKIGILNSYKLICYYENTFYF